MVAKFKQPNYNTDGGTAYPLGLDAAIAVLAELAAQFAVSAQDTPNMTVAMRPGRLYLADRTLVSVAAQNSAALTAPSTNPRKDIVYIDYATGAIDVVQGAESAIPADPAIPAGKLPKARINWTVGAAQITNSMIDDLRPDPSSLEAVLNYLSSNSLGISRGGTGANNIAAAQSNLLVKPAGYYAPHAETNPIALKTVVDAGSLFVNGGLVANAAQTMTHSAADPTNPRIDRVVIDALTGAASILAGTPAGSPVAPAIPSGKFPVAQVLITANMTVIGNSAITDERTGQVPDQNRPCASGYVRVTPNFCMKTGYSSFSSLTRDTQTILTPPVANAKALLVNLVAIAKSANSAGARYAAAHYSGQTISGSPFFSDGFVIAQAYEFSALAAGTVLSESSAQIIINKSAGFYLYLDDDGGNQGAGSYEIRGYFD